HGCVAAPNATEIVVDGGAVDPGALGDFKPGDRVQAAFSEDLARGLKQTPPRVWSVRRISQLDGPGANAGSGSHSSIIRGRKENSKRNFKFKFDINRSRDPRSRRSDSHEANSPDRSADPRPGGRGRSCLVAHPSAQ